MLRPVRRLHAHPRNLVLNCAPFSTSPQTLVIASEHACLSSNLKSMSWPKRISCGGEYSGVAGGGGGRGGVRGGEWTGKKNRAKNRRTEVEGEWDGKCGQVKVIDCTQASVPYRELEAYSPDRPSTAP